MTQIARLVLDDCRLALEELPDPPNGTSRQRWVTVVALLRSVAYVLDSRDRSDDAMSRAIDWAWARLKTSRPQPEIFWGFVDDERQGILHAYEFKARQDTTIRINPRPMVYNGGRGGMTLVQPAVISRSVSIMNDGPFKGLKPKDVAQQALSWLRDWLDGIDAEAAKLRSAGQGDKQ